MYKIVLSFALIALLASCTSSTKKKQVVVKSNTQFNDFKEYAQNTSPNIRTPNDAVIFFRSTQASFMPQLVNSPLSYVKYTENKELASANIGVYWVDALYQYSYKQMDGAKASAKSAIQLAETLGIGDVFKEVLIDRYTDNEKVDSFFIKLDESFMNAEYILSERDRMRIYISMLMGKYIQTQYILFSLIFDYPDDVTDDEKLTLLQELVFVVKRNLESTNALIRLIDKYQKPSDTMVLSNQIRVFGESYKSLDFEGGLYSMTPEKVFENDKLKLMYSQIKDMHSFVTMMDR